MGYEKFMMDLDLCGAAHTYLKGFDLSRKISSPSTASPRSGRASTSSPRSTPCATTRRRSTSRRSATRRRSSNGATRANEAAKIAPRRCARGAGQLRGATDRRRRRRRVARLHRPPQSFNARPVVLILIEEDRHVLWPSTCRPASTPSIGTSYAPIACSNSCRAGRPRLRGGTAERPDEHPLRHGYTHVQRVDVACPRSLRVRSGRRPGRAVRVRHLHAPHDGLDSIDELRKAVPWFYFLAGPRTQEKAELWSRDIIDLMRQLRRRRPAPGGRSLRAVGRTASHRRRHHSVRRPRAARAGPA